MAIEVRMEGEVRTEQDELRLPPIRIAESEYTPTP